MPVVKLTLSEEEKQELKNLADAKGMSMQDFIKEKVFNRKNIFTPSEAVNRALATYKSGECFTVPDLYPGEWQNMTRGPAGVLGREFKNLVESQYASKIRLKDHVNSGRHARYEII